MRSRGLTYEVDGDAAAQPSMRVKAEAADGTIVQMFEFQHVK